MRRNDLCSTSSFFLFLFIFLSLLLNHVGVVDACSGHQEIAFHHKMYPVTVAPHQSWLSLRIYRSAHCIWTKNERSVPRLFNQPTSLDEVYVNNKLNAYTLLFEGEAANFSCSCDLILAYCRVRFSVDFFAVRNAKGWWRTEAFDNDLRVRKQYPLHERCMQREADFNAFYHFYLDKRQDELKKPQACVKQNRAYNLIVRPIYLSDKGKNNVRVRCDFRGEPRPKVTVAYNGRPLKRNNKFILSYSSFGKFIIRNAEASDGGLVSCTASNRYGEENLYILLFMVHRSSLSTEFSVQESETVYNVGGNSPFVELTCPTTPKKTTMLVVWAEIRDSSLVFMWRNVLRINVTRSTSSYLCIVCFVNRCQLNRIHVSHGLSVGPGRESDEWNREKIDRKATTTGPSEEEDGKKEEDTDLGQFIFWVVLGLYGCVFLVLMLRLSVARACRPISSRETKIDVQNLQDYRTPTPYARSFSSYNTSPSLMHSSYKTLFEEYVPMFSDCDSISAVSSGRYEKLSTRNFMKIRILGEGYYGKVTLAKMTSGWLRGQLVAVKELKDKPYFAEYHNTSSLSHETFVLRKIGLHRNVVRLLGWSSFPHPFIITEFCSRGNLRSHLTGLRADSYSDSAELGQFKSFAFQVAQGMAFVASKQFVHGDLAARNILLTDSFVCKVADFGLARQMHGDSSEYRIGKHSYLPMPTRWLAPEALNDEIMTMTSDVWSFGILVWEIFSVGATPYNDHSAREIKHLVNRGYRLPRPALCPDSVWSIMREAWNFDPVKRTTFVEIVEKLNQEE